MWLSGKNGEMDRAGNFETSYSAVEAALAQAYRIPDTAMGAFRGRLGSLQKQGILGPRNRPGKGVALSYGPDQFHRLVFACELFEFGVAPSTVLDLVQRIWDRRIAEIFRQAEQAAMREPGGDDVIMHMGGVALMGYAFADTLPNVNSCPLRRLPDHMRMWMTMGPDDPAGLPPRVLVVNLSMRLRAFHRALADAHLASERLIETAAADSSKSRLRNEPKLVQAGRRRARRQKRAGRRRQGRDR